MCQRNKCNAGEAQIVHNEESGPRIQVVSQHGAGCGKPKPGKQDKTNIHQRWLDMASLLTEPVQQMCAASLDIMSFSQIMKVQQYCGLPGVQCTTYFVSLSFHVKVGH